MATLAIANWINKSEMVNWPPHSKSYFPEFNCQPLCFVKHPTCRMVLTSSLLASADSVNNRAPLKSGRFERQCKSLRIVDYDVNRTSVTEVTGIVLRKKHLADCFILMSVRRDHRPIYGSRM